VILRQLGQELWNEGWILVQDSKVANGVRIHDDPLPVGRIREIGRVFVTVPSVGGSQNGAADRPVSGVWTRIGTIPWSILHQSWLKYEPESAAPVLPIQILSINPSYLIWNKSCCVDDSRIDSKVQVWERFRVKWFGRDLVRWRMQSLGTLRWKQPRLIWNVLWGIEMQFHRIWSIRVDY